MKLVQQRTDHDCTICCIAMALGFSYETVLQAGLEAKAFDPDKGALGESRILEALGLSYRFEHGEPVGDFVHRTRGFEVSPEFFRSMAWGRRAVLSVPSLNKPGGWHSVYWTGAALADPSTRATYTAWDQLKPDEMTIFRERA